MQKPPADPPEDVPTPPKPEPHKLQLPPFVRWLRDARIVHGLTRGQLAAETGFSESMLRGFEFCRFRVKPEQRLKLIDAIRLRDPKLADAAPELEAELPPCG